MIRFARLALGDGSFRYARLSSESPPSMAHLLDGAPWLESIEGASVRFDEAMLRAPATPSKIIGVGRNYHAHAAELDNPVPEYPLLFLKPPSALLAPGGVVRLPPESDRVDYEAELAVVIGKRGRRIPPEHALAHVFGYTIACDVTARDLQRRDGQWGRAKGFDGFCPLGPWIVSDWDPGGARVRLWIGDELRQDGATSDMVFGVPELVAATSSAMTLEAGDLILTGTPAGVGKLEPGDRVRIEITDLGSLCFEVDAEASPASP
jgi:2-keto-4-pentenoate hydratase/2-oxohepta-3-ene-1,7-dioic acid hydratase in catechol pathway